MTTKHHNLTPTACWTSSDVAGLERTWLLSIEIVELPEDRWSVSLYSADIEGSVNGCVFPTRAAAIRSEAAAAIRHARDLVAERRSGIETVFSISDEHFRTYVAWLRGIVAEEASRKQAAIESFERGCRRATDWIVDREIELGVAGMHPSADVYPAQLAKAWGKYNEYQAALKELRKPVETAPIAAPAEPVSIVDRILAAGLAPNRYLFNLNGLYDYDGMNAKGDLIPSRAYGRPFVYVPADKSADGREHVYLETPYRETPHSAKVMSVLGDVVEVRERIENGARPWRWWHAVDLMNDQHYRRLLDSREFTNDSSIEAAVRFALDCPSGWDTPAQKKRGRISLAVAREVLAAIGVEEPADRSVNVLLDREAFRISDAPEGKGKVFNANGRELAWAFVHELEDGWLKRDRKGYLVPTDKLIEAHETAAAEPVKAPEQAVTAEPFHAHLDLGRTLGAGIHLRRLNDSWQARHDCSWGNGGHSIQHHGRFPTQRAAYDHAVMRIRKTAQWAIEAGDSVRLMARIGEPDVRRAKQILAWLDGLVPPGPDEVAETVIDPAPLAPPKRIYLGAPASPVATIAVAPNEDGRWSQASVVHLGIHGYDDFALDVGPTYATEDAAWETAIRKVHVFLSGIRRTKGKALEYAVGWIDGVARERGIDLRDGGEPDLFGAAA